MATVRYMDPAGNITAIVRKGAGDINRVRLAKQILKDEKAEQVGFETEPIRGGDCRLEMMGGEFCGNALRSYAYLVASEKYSGGRHAVKVEMSGVSEPIVANVDLDAELAYVQMPLPLGVDEVTVNGTKYPVIHMQGIDHLILEGAKSDEELAEEALKAMGQWQPSACGILFLNGDDLVPVVYVRSTESLVWESSCGSGSVACAWYLAGCTHMLEQDGVYRLNFTQPGGEIQAGVMVKGGKVVQCMMGGGIKMGSEETVLEGLIAEQ